MPRWPSRVGWLSGRNRWIDRTVRIGIMCEVPMSIPEPPNVFKPEGAIDLHVSPELRASLNVMIDAKPQRLVVDLSSVPYVDSSGLAILIGAMQRLEHEGGVFMLAGAQKAVRTILESARLDQYFHMFPHVDAALAAPIDRQSTTG